MSRIEQVGDEWVGTNADGTVQVVVGPCWGYGPPPDWCQQLPVYRIEGAMVEQLNRVTRKHHDLDGCDYEQTDGLSLWFEDALERVWLSGSTSARRLKILRRWLQVFHDGDLAHLADGGVLYVTYRTRQGDREWGMKLDPADGDPNARHGWAGDLRAWHGWAMGEVYRLSVRAGVDVSGSAYDVISEWEETEEGICYDLSEALAEGESYLT